MTMKWVISDNKHLFSQVLGLGVDEFESPNAGTGNTVLFWGIPGDKLFYMFLVGPGNFWQSLVFLGFHLHQ